MKFVVAMTKIVEIPGLMSAIGHCTVGLAQKIKDSEKLGLITYINKDGNQ